MPHTYELNLILETRKYVSIVMIENVENIFLIFS